MEFISEFKEFLDHNWIEDCDGKVSDSIRYEKLLIEAGLEKEKASKADSKFLSELMEAEEYAYSRGIKAGFRLALHLLGMAPENVKEVSQ